MIAIVDTGGANIASIQIALRRLGCESQLTSDPRVIRQAQRVVLPGVSHMAHSMAILRLAGLDRLIPTLTVPVLGICSGMHILYDGSEEGDVQGLGVFAGTVRRLQGVTPVPHMGWNTISPRVTEPLAQRMGGQHYYFVHSYCAPVCPHTLAVCNYGQPFAAVVNKNNVLATQFHPEKSGAAGQEVLKYFAEM